MKMLAEQDKEVSARQEREINAMDRREELEALEERGDVVQSGRWLFWKRLREKTLQLVGKLFKYPPRELNSFGFSFEFPDYDTITYGCVTRGCPGCEGDSQRHWADCSEPEKRSEYPVSLLEPRKEK